MKNPSIVDHFGRRSENISSDKSFIFRKQIHKPFSIARLLSNSRMNKLKIELNPRGVIIIYILIDLICVGAGMGVPIFCILLGFPLGWYITKRVTASTEQLYQKCHKIFKFSIFASIFTFVVMLIVWLSAILINIESSSDIQNFGHPYILYDPKASFIGWLILMVIISPFLQLLTTVFGAFLALMRPKIEEQSDKNSITSDSEEISG